MSLASQIARKSLVKRPGRTLFSVLGIAVGIATVVLVFTLDHNTMLSRRRPDGEWTADVEVRPRRGIDDPLGALESVPGVADISRHFQQDVRVHAGSADGDPDVGAAILVALEAEIADLLGVYHVREGRGLAPAAPVAECLVGMTLAERFGLAVGDRLYLSKPARAAKRVCLDGELTVSSQEPPKPVDWPFTVVGVLEDERIGRKSGGQVVVVDFERGRELYADARIDESYWVRKDPAVDLERLQASLGEGFSFDLNEKSVVVGQTADERAFRNGVRLAGLFAMMLGLYVIFHTLSMSLVERLREVGILNALGSTRRQIARIFFLEALVIASLGGALGLGAGLLLARSLLRAGVTTLGVGKRVFQFDVPWEVVGPLTAVGVGIALAGAIYPLMKARATNTVAVLRGEELEPQTGVARGFNLFAAVLLTLILPGLFFTIAPVVGELQGAYLGVVLVAIAVLALLVVVAFVVPSLLARACARLAGLFERPYPLAGLLAARTIRHGAGRIAASVTAIALVTTAFVGLKGMTNSLRSEVEVWAEQGVRGKLWVRGLPSVTLDELRAKLPPEAGVIGIEPGDSRIASPFRLVGLSTGELARYGPCRDDPGLLRALESGQGVIVSHRAANRFGYAVGDAVLVNAGLHGVQSFPVVAIADDYGYFPEPDERLYGVVADHYWKSYFCLDTDTTEYVALRLREGTDHLAAVAALRAAFPDARGLNFKHDDYIVAWHVEDITRDFRLFDIILGMTALLAGLGVLNGQLLAALERWKELGVLRALGMSRGQVAGMVLLESGVIGVVGGVSGAGLGALLTPVIVEALQTLSSLPLPHRTAGTWLAWSTAGAIAVTGLAACYPIWRMNRADAIRAVRTG